MNKQKLTAGIVGAGYIAKSHADAYHVHPDVRLAYVTDLDLDRATQLAAAYGAQAFSTLDEMLESDVAVVSVCTPTPTHADIVLAALEAGKSVLCEKPISRTADQARQMIRASHQSAGILMIGHVSRFEPDHRTARDVVASGSIGEIRMMSQSIVGPMPDWSQNRWLVDPIQSGGPFLDLAIHSFDYLTWACGAVPVRVSAVGSVGAGTLVDLGVATVLYDNGALALVETSWAHPVAQGLTVATELVGANGRIAWDYEGVSLGKLFTEVSQRAFSPLGHRGFHAEIAAFVAAVQSGGPSPVPAEEGLTALRLSLAALESIDSGVAIDVAIDGKDTATT